MAKICRKKSKRVPLKRRYNIEKKVKSHNKKLKKVARKEKQARKLKKVAMKEQKEKTQLQGVTKPV